MMRPSSLLLVATGAALLLLPAPAGAQANNKWVTFSKQNSNLSIPALPDVGHTAMTDIDTQVVFRTGDLDKDGWDDVVAVRKQQASQVGKRTAVLLMNVNGVLTDKTVQYATATDVVGDLGFRTPCNNREVAIGDVNGDTWPDVVTCVSLSDGDTKVISHPRVYINLGEDIDGHWLGLRFENARFPQLFTVGGSPVAPRFCGMGLGDVTGDGAADIYFVDYDTTETGINELAGADLNDRLLVNDGNGFFTDESAARFTTAQLQSQFGADLEMVDLNLDGHLDVIKDTTLDPPRVVRILYNDPNNVGNFTAFGTQDIDTGSPYGMDFGNLNNDGIIDVAVTDDGADKFHFGTGYDGLNRVTWGPAKTFTFVAGGDNEFGHNVYIRDLDLNGWNDVLITDVDGDLTGCARRLHVYHNIGTTPGTTGSILKEEAEVANTEFGTGWKGVVGMTANDEKGCYDVGFGDFDHDGDLDLVVATCNGTNYWRNETDPGCQADLGFAGPGSMAFSICGDGLTHAGNQATFSLTGAAPSSPVFLPVGFANNPVGLKGGTLVPNPFLMIVTGITTNGLGNVSLTVGGSNGTPTHVYMQCIVKNGPTFEFSNALDVVFGL